MTVGNVSTVLYYDHIRAYEIIDDVIKKFILSTTSISEPIHVSTLDNKRYVPKLELSNTFRSFINRFAVTIL